MQLERDELVKRVFPRVRRHCEQRGVRWSEVDLRWGVTDEQKADGAVLPICLAEIDRTRPYFIGLLGQRYGWVPDELAPPLVASLGWLTDDVGRSVTELEILHGVLNDPEAAGHAFFYLRDPAWVDALAPDERALYVEESPEGVERLAALRARVAASGHSTATYSDPVALGERVLADLTALVDRLYPANETPDSLAHADALHAAYGRARFGLDIDRPDLAAELDHHAAGSGPPLLVTGDPGIGASSLATRWAWSWAAAHPDAHVVTHHVDADTTAGDPRALVSRLVAALTLDGAPDSGALDGAAPPALRAALRRAMRATRTPTVIVIDNVDRLDDVDGAPDLRWLPTDVPAGVRIIMTASGSRPRTAFEHRGWPMLTVTALTGTERRAIATVVLAAGAKALDADNAAVLVASSRTGNARFLRTVLDELRQHGDHFTLRSLIERLTAAATVDDLLELVLARYERDFDRDRPGLTRDAFTALWAARRGLAESELLELLAAPGDTQLPQAVWAPLHLAAEHGLVARGGLLGFAHPDLQRAVEDRYLRTDDARRAAHALLAAFFAARPLSGRVTDELGWQYADAGDAAALRTTLADLDFVELAYTRDAADVRRLWSRLAGTGDDLVGAMTAAYRPVIDDPAAHDASTSERPVRQLVWGVARLLGDAGAPRLTLGLQRHLVAAAREDPAGSDDEPGGDAKLRAALVNLGAAQLAQGDLPGAETTLREAVERCRAARADSMLVAALGNLAMTRRDLGDAGEAAALFAEEQQLCRAIDDEYGLQASLGNHAQLARDLGRHDEAMAMLREQERICRDLADPAAIARSLAGQATVLADRGDLAAAIALTEQQVAVARDEGDVRGLTEALLNLAVNRTQALDHAGADAAATESETLARRLADPALLARVLVTRASNLAGTGDWSSAERVAREAELTARDCGADRLVPGALSITGTARREQGDLHGSLAAHEAELTAATAIADEAAIATAQTNLGNVAIAEQHYDHALDWYDAAVPTFERLDLPIKLLPVLANRGQLHQMAGRFPEAVADLTDAADAAARLGQHAAVRQWAEPALGLAYQLGDTARAETLWHLLAGAARAAGDDAMLQKALGDGALLLINRAQSATGDPHASDQQLLGRAAAMLDEQEEICRRIDDAVGLAACIGNRAIVLRYQGDLAGSLRCLDEQLDIATRSGNAHGALFATANRGEVLGLLGHIPEALEALSRARETAASYGLAPMVQQLDAMIAALS